MLASNKFRPILLRVPMALLHHRYNLPVGVAFRQYFGGEEEFPAVGEQARMLLDLPESPSD